MSRRTCSIVVLFLLLGCRNFLAQQGEKDLPAAERAYVATKCYSALEIYFAHRDGVPELDLDAAYKEYLERAMRARGRYEFDLATLEFVALFRNKHTQFNDQWLLREYGQPLGFQVAPAEGKWTITRTRDNRLSKGDVIRSIDGKDIEAFIHDKQRYIAASSERSTRSLVFDRSYLFPRHFTLELEDGRKISIERNNPDQGQTQALRVPASEGRWLSEGSVGYIKISSFNDANFEKTAIELVKNYHGAKCLIIDVRSNGGGGTPYALIRELMDREWRNWSTSTPLHIALSRAQGVPSAQLRTNGGRSQPQAGAFTGRLLLLVDRFSCSACEDFIMPFKDNGRATIIGETTEGSSGQPYFFNFGNGMSLLVGAARYSFPDGSPFESVGITPTIPVALRLADVRNGVDPVLEKARETASAP
jgi:carboxyl-terminal processing protease